MALKKKRKKNEEAVWADDIGVDWKDLFNSGNTFVTKTFFCQ